MKIQKRSCIFRDLVLVLLCSLFVAFFSWKLTGCDLHFHLTRLTELADHIRREDLFAYPFAINFSSCEGMGYAAPLFYGDLLLLPSALLTAAGIPARIVYALTAAVCVFLSWLSMRGALRYFYPEGAAVRLSAAALVYALSNFVLYESVERSAMGSILLFPIFPWVFASFFSLLLGNEAANRRRDALLLALSLGTVLITHLQSALILVLFLLATALLYFRKTFSRQIFVCLVGAAICFFGLTAWFWAPLVEQILYQPLYLTTPSIPAGKYDLTSEIVAWPTVLVPNYVYKWGLQLLNAWLGKNYSFPADTSWNWAIPACWWAGFFVFALAVVGLWRCRRSISHFSLSVGISSAFAVFIVFSFTDLLCFQNLFGFLQFPWRSMLLFTILLPFLVMEIPPLLSPSKDALILRLAAIGGTATYLFAFAILLQAPMAVDQSSVGQGEYLPAARYPLASGQVKLPEDTYLDSVTIVAGGYEVILAPGWEKEPSLLLPITSYKGYSLVSAESGQIISDLQPGEYGLLCVDTADLSSERFLVLYTGTPVQQISRLISLIALVVWIVLWRRARTNLPRPEAA